MKSKDISKFSHEIIKSKQKCFPAAWWPTADDRLHKKERVRPLMYLESGQVTRVNRSNLRVID